MEIGDRIRAARKKVGFSQIITAEKAGIAVNSLRLYERNKRIPNMGQLQKIADALETDIATLMGWPAGTVRVMTQREKQEVLADVEDTLRNLILVDFDKLTEEGQQKAQERVQELTEIPKYCKKKSPKE